MQITSCLRKYWLQGTPNYVRANARRLQLERRRLRDSETTLPPMEPSPAEARCLFRQLLKEGYRTLQLTDKEYYRTKLRYEFEVTSRQTSARVRGIMFEKGKWMLGNKLGGLL